MEEETDRTAEAQEIIAALNVGAEVSWKDAAHQLALQVAHLKDKLEVSRRETREARYRSTRIF